MIPASWAVVRTSPLGRSPRRSAVPGLMRTNARARARRRAAGLPPTSTMRTAPLSSTWLRSSPCTPEAYAERHPHPLEVERPRVPAQEAVAEDAVDGDPAELGPEVGEDAEQAGSVLLGQRPERHPPQREAPEADARACRRRTRRPDRSTAAPGSRAGRASPRERDGRSALVLEAGVDDERQRLPLVERAARAATGAWPRARRAPRRRPCPSGSREVGARARRPGSRRWPGTGATALSRSPAAPAP